MRGFVRSLVDVTAAELGVEREVGVLLALEVFEVGEAAGRLEFVVDVGFRRHRFDFVVDRLHFLVFGDDGVGGSFGNMRIGGEHDRDRLADKADLVHRQDRLIVERRAVIGIGDDFNDILRGDDAKTPGIFFAALVSIDLMRPCATVERKILPCSMPGRRIRCVYSARPVTFSRASRRGTERPNWPPPIGLVGIGDSAPCCRNAGTACGRRQMGNDYRYVMHANL